MLHVLTKNGQKLFSGTRRQAKQFIRKNNIKNYVLKEHFIEKVAVVATEEKPNTLSQPETPEGFFNKVFDNTNE